jgi:hypothetical protein
MSTPTSESAMQVKLTDTLSETSDLEKYEDTAISFFLTCDASWTALNEYWNKTDDQTALVVSMILDPRCKVQG